MFLVFPWPTGSFINLIFVGRPLLWRFTTSIGKPSCFFCKLWLSMWLIRDLKRYKRLRAPKIWFLNRWGQISLALDRMCCPLRSFGLLHAVRQVSVWVISWFRQSYSNQTRVWLLKLILAYYSQLIDNLTTGTVFFHLRAVLVLGLGRIVIKHL